MIRNIDIFGFDLISKEKKTREIKIVVCARFDHFTKVVFPKSKLRLSKTISFTLRDKSYKSVC